MESPTSEILVQDIYQIGLLEEVKWQPTKDN
jgi:hypothetical protein